MSETLTPSHSLESIDQSFPSDSDSSFSSVDSLRDSVAYISTIVDLPKALEISSDYNQISAEQIGGSDPLTYVSINIPRMTKPHLVDIIINSFSEAKYKLDVNPPLTFSNTHYEYDMVNQLSTHPKIINPTELRRHFGNSTQIVGGEEQSTGVFTLEYKEFFIVCAKTDREDIIEKDTEIVTHLWRFVDISRIGNRAQHFTKFVVYCLCSDEQPSDIANMIAVLFDIPAVYSSLWNAHSSQQIIASIEQSETMFLTDLAEAHQAIDRVNDRMFSDRKSVV